MKPQLLVSVEENLPGNFADELNRKIQFEGLDLRVESRPKMGPCASLEWLLPTAAILYISKSYFDGFLKEMGKDHYLLLKKGLNIAWKKFFSKEKVVNISLIASKEGKLSESKKYSLAFSILAELDENHNIKFLFEDDLSDEAFNLRINLIFDLLKALNDNEPYDNFLELEDIRPIGRTILIAFDEGKGKLVALDPVPRKQS